MESDAMDEIGESESNLSVLPIDPIHNGLVGRIAEPAIYTRRLIMGITFSQSFRAEVVGVAERFMDALKHVAASHEDLFKSFNRGSLHG